MYLNRLHAPEATMSLACSNTCISESLYAGRVPPAGGEVDGGLVLWRQTAGAQHVRSAELEMVDQVSEPAILGGPGHAASVRLA